METVIGAFDFANHILEIALIVVPSILGLGALATFSYGIVSTGNYLVKEGVGLLKLGAGIVTGGAIGAVAGLRAGIGAYFASQRGIGVKEVIKTAGEEALRGATHGIFGQRGILQTVNRALHGQDIERKLLESRGTVTKVHRIEEEGKIKEVVVSRPALDYEGKFETKAERTIILDRKEPVKSQHHKETFLLTPHNSPEEFRKSLEKLDKIRELNFKIKGFRNLKNA